MGKLVDKLNAAEPNCVVSIVLPTFNRARLIRRAIQSILDQTYVNFELIVVDDCSKDETERVVKSFPDRRIRYLRHEENKGAVAARNTGIMAARGEYVAFQDSDDEWLPQKLYKQMNAFNSAPLNLGVVYTSYWLIDNGTITYAPPLDCVKQTEGYIHTSLLVTNFVNAPTAVVRRECFEKAGMFESLPRLQEWGLWLRISKYYEFKHINEPLIKAYRQPDSISRNMKALIVARKYILSKYFEEISEKPKLLSKHYFEIGTLLCLNAEIAEGRKYFFRAMQANPLNAKLQLSAFASAFGQNVYDRVTGFYLHAKYQ
jgi:glycosyltransferase involved in cell wall biosynthesis